jgi:Integrase core domain
MDFLYMGPSVTKHKYLLLLKDDFSGYLQLVPCTTADANAAVDALVNWFATFGVVPTWVSDRGSHVKNQTMTGVQRALHSQHHFTTAYNTWDNGTVERACLEVLRGVRALLSEFKLLPAEWPRAHHLVHSALNHSPSPQRGNVAPITPFTGLPASSPLLALVSEDQAKPATLTEIEAQRALHLETIRPALDAIHKRCLDSAAAHRTSWRSKRNSKRGTSPPKFDVGDFVLIAQRDTQSINKLSLRWRGPRRIVRVLSDHVYEIED